MHTINVYSLSCERNYEDENYVLNVKKKQQPNIWEFKFYSKCGKFCKIGLCFEIVCMCVCVCCIKSHFNENHFKYNLQVQFRRFSIHLQ